MKKGIRYTLLAKDIVELKNGEEVNLYIFDGKKGWEWTTNTVQLDTFIESEIND